MTQFIECPICQKPVKINDINLHLDLGCDNGKPQSKKRNIDRYSMPLAERLRPATFSQLLGRAEITGETSVLQSLANQKNIPSILLYGPPGSGKTTIARLLLKTFPYCRSFSGASNNISDIRQGMADMLSKQKVTGTTGCLFIDEIHRLSKVQQDALLPVEAGGFILIAATTENPSFSVNSALLSRLRVFCLPQFNQDDVKAILERAVASFDDSISVDSGVIDFISGICDGDTRSALNMLEVGVLFAVANRLPLLSLQNAKQAIQKSHVNYDRVGDQHYDIISAFHKSIRGSEENATLYWLQRMLSGGEDPLYIARRMIRIASEDIGLADNNALLMAIACHDAVQKIGMPECDVTLAHVATYLARAPKSIEIYRALKNAKNMIQTRAAYPVPIHLRNAPTKLMKEMGFGAEYKYNPDYSEPVEQDYLPTEIKDIAKFF